MYIVSSSGRRQWININITGHRDYIASMILALNDLNWFLHENSTKYLFLKIRSEVAFLNDI